MANKSTVAADLRRFAVFVQGLTAAADTLDQMQSLEETALATEQRVTAAQAALADMTGQVQVAQQELLDVRAKASASVKDATKRAQDKADALIAAAEMQATSVTQAAQAQADAIVSPAQSQVDELLAQAASLNEQLQRMKDDEGDMLGRAIAARSELDELESKLSAARESIAKLLG